MVVRLYFPCFIFISFEYIEWTFCSFHCYKDNVLFVDSNKLMHHCLFNSSPMLQHVDWLGRIGGQRVLNVLRYFIDIHKTHDKSENVYLKLKKSIFSTIFSPKLYTLIPANFLKLIPTKLSNFDFKLRCLCLRRYAFSRSVYRLERRMNFLIHSLS